MTAEIISIGEELLIGQTVNTNAAWLAKKLNEIGIGVKQVVVITDNHNDIVNALMASSQRSDLVLATGGLGPTRDDVTKKALCQVFNSKLIVDESVMADNKQFFHKRGLPFTDLNKNQALVPDNAKIIRNPYGTAPGLWFENGENILVSMPGVPFEMQHMTIDYVIPALKNLVHGFYIVHKTILTQGIGESFLAEKISSWENSLPGFITLAYLPSPGMVKLRLSGKGTDKSFIEKAIETQIQQLTTIIPQYIWGYDDEKLEGLIGKKLTEGGFTLCTAESCTGGYIAHKITSIPGSSAYYKGSVIAYSNQIKEKILSVDPELINSVGAVSKEVVEMMAQQAKELFNTDFSLAVSGIAGPTGGSNEKPVGTVWIAATSNHQTITRKYNFGDTRERNIVRASMAALGILKNMLDQ